MTLCNQTISNQIKPNTTPVFRLYDSTTIVHTMHIGFCISCYFVIEREECGVKREGYKKEKEIEIVIERETRSKKTVHNNNNKILKHRTQKPKKMKEGETHICNKHIILP
jgi:hypothetical protein